MAVRPVHHGCYAQFSLAVFHQIPTFPSERERYDFPNFPQNAPVSSPRCYILVLTASIRKLGDAWRALIPPQGSQVHFGSFADEGAQAVAWARKVEAEMDARRVNDTRGLANITLKELIDWYLTEIGTDTAYCLYENADLYDSFEIANNR